MLDDPNQTQPPPPPPTPIGSPNAWGAGSTQAQYGGQRVSEYHPGQPYPPSPYANGYQPPPRRSPWFWVSIIGGGFAIVALLITAMIWSSIKSLSGTSTPAFGAGSQIAVIDIDGAIMDAEKIDNQLNKFGNDSSVKAILLHINSPGGGAAVSQEIYHEVVRIRTEKHKKIVAAIDSVGASGAYYIASGCDRIYANQASVVGSIGVIMEWTNYGDLMRWAKLKSVVIHAGELKDAGDPSRDMTPKEAAYFQSLTDNMYGQFIRDVSAGRKIPVEKLQPLATGQVWTGEQSLPLGFIDQIGGYHVALMDTAKSVGISGEPSVVRPNSAKKGLAAILSGDADDFFPNPSKLFDHAPGFYFMWK